MLSYITPVILTYNEEPNIERTLQKLNWADRIVVIDSYSTDETLDILEKYPKVDVFKRKFDSYAPQWNYGLDQVQTDWILSLDSDYILPDELISELAQLTLEDHIDGYFARFKYCVFGKPLRGTILPPRQILSRKGRSSYINDGHTQLLKVKGESGHLKNYIYHDDRKALSRWLWAQDRYMLIEVKKLRETPDNELSMGDRIRKRKVVAPFVILLYCLVLKGGVLDGWRGWYYAFQRMFAETLLSLRLIEKECP
ncbi:glycosyltransferase family 2 protein [Leptothoe sp. PORK10 BA2]|uniref:glycosyltransferase family 2 protein n=1 Tax=Leptothoe sp. PORK10 BA2 TaxID=3110254 RepID=UPI002B210B40|nr:glycosyltransferase family 2 protein [Leptothoe sp. PORK10 BA2]MEA5466499.1 glycosyltransferase family 2 protein [Leptothoe sp. PORK10 BA2]